MQFPYQCEGCKKHFDVEYAIGKAPRTVSCPTCGKTARRSYEGMSVAVKISGTFARMSSFGEQMKAKNEAAGKRMKMNRPPVRLKAFDHGNGDIREAK